MLRFELTLAPIRFVLSSLRLSRLLFGQLGFRRCACVTVSLDSLVSSLRDAQTLMETRFPASNDRTADPREHQVPRNLNLLSTSRSYPTCPSFTAPG